SARTSPTATASPSPFFHSTRRPSSMVGERASMTTLVAMLGIPVQHLVYRCDHLGGVDLGRPLEKLVVRHGHVGAGNSDDRGIELVEALTLNGVHDLGAHAGERPSFLRNYAAVGARHGGDHRLFIERADRPQVYHFRLYLLRGELLGGLERD